MKGCALMLLLAIAGCVSRGAVVPVAAICPISPAPPAWMTLEPSNPLKLLDELFSMSEQGSLKTGRY
ncbi:Rz1 family lipoprotein [Pseudomonas paraversuta]